jgi:hypothetical protein
MSIRIDVYHRLEARPADRDLQNGFSARLHDPLWLLARQWQMGEHQGENATSPVRAECRVTRTPLKPIDGDAAFDPRVVPAEALVESELDDWWTFGRRARAGRRLTAAHPALAANGALLFVDPPPPYDALAGQLDGRAVWRRRVELGVMAADFGADRPDADAPPAWNATELHYETTVENAERPLLVTRHHGGPMDWYSADGDASQPAADPPGPPLQLSVAPTPLSYPGAPSSRFWEIEDADVDIGGYPPDTAHVATMLLVDLVYSHGDDWFVLPITAHAGHIVTIQSLSVTDSFGRSYRSDDEAGGVPVHPGLRAPADFTLFKSRDLADAALVLWPVAESPLESDPIERVQFGVDEHSNVLWALERIIDGREAGRRSGDVDLGHPPYPPEKPGGNATVARAFRYVPARGIESRWHPYELDWASDEDVSFFQRGLVDYSLQVPKPMPRPDAEVLKASDPGKLHRIAAAAMSSGGLELERRWQLARDMNGKPVLWIQRQRKALRTPPARTLRFDALEESTIPS